MGGVAVQVVEDNALGDSRLVGGNRDYQWNLGDCQEDQDSAHCMVILRVSVLLSSLIRAIFTA